MPGSPINIRPYQESDAEQILLAVHVSLPDVSPWMPDLNADVTLQKIRAYIAAQPDHRTNREAYNFAIVDRQGTFLGGCGLTQVNWQHRFANLYYWIRSSQTRKGAASTAARLLAHFGFCELELQRIEIVVAVDNLPSIRAAEKTGAMREGRLRTRINVNGRVHDAFMYSLIPTDLK